MTLFPWRKVVGGRSQLGWGVGPGPDPACAGSDDRSRAHRRGKEQAARHQRAEDRQSDLVKVGMDRHFVSPLNLATGPSGGHARDIAAAVPEAKNGGKPPFLRLRHISLR